MAPDFGRDHYRISLEFQRATAVQHAATPMALRQWQQPTHTTRNRIPEYSARVRGYARVQTGCPCWARGNSYTHTLQPTPRTQLAPKLADGCRSENVSKPRFSAQRMSSEPLCIKAALAVVHPSTKTIGHTATAPVAATHTAHPPPPRLVAPISANSCSAFRGSRCHRSSSLTPHAWPRPLPARILLGTLHVACEVLLLDFERSYLARERVHSGPLRVESSLVVLVGKRRIEPMQCKLGDA